MGFKTFYLIEAIHGKRAIVYHRVTSGREKLKNITDKGGRLQIGRSNMYGEGIYTVYDLDFMTSSHMDGYGNIIVKNMANMANILVLDPEQAKKVHGKNWRIDDQLVNVFKVFKSKEDIPEHIQRRIDQIDGMEHSLKVHDSGKKYTSEFANEFMKIPNIKNNVHGVSFHGSNDGYVVVFFYPADLYPIAYANKDSMGENGELKWESTLQKAVMRDTVQQMNLRQRDSVHGTGMKTLNDYYQAYEDKEYAKKSWVKNTNFKNYTLSPEEIEIVKSTSEIAYKYAKAKGFENIEPEIIQSIAKNSYDSFFLCQSKRISKYRTRDYTRYC